MGAKDGSPVPRFRKSIAENQSCGCAWAAGKVLFFSAKP
jgi:hypothetical protein